MSFSKMTISSLKLRLSRLVQVIILSDFSLFCDVVKHLNFVVPVPEIGFNFCYLLCDFELDTGPSRFRLLLCKDYRIMVIVG